jgi:hypothetical protein
VQKPLAAFAYLDELPATHARITSAGVRRTSSDGMPTAYKWEYEKVEAYLEERAYRTLETLMQYLDEHAADYTEWLDQDIVKERKALLIKNGGQFQQYFPVQYPYLSWFRFLPMLRELTQTHITASFGIDFYNELMGITNNDATTDPAHADSVQLVYLLQMALTNLCIYQATEKLPVSISGLGFSIRMATGTQTSENQTAAGDAIKGLAKRCYDDGKMYLRRAINHANSVASAEKFNTYFTSVHYTAPDTSPINRKNEVRKTFRF